MDCNMPKYLFKYKAVSTVEDLVRLIDIIKEHRIYFPSIKQLNDPQEGTLFNAQISRACGFFITEAHDDDYYPVREAKEKFNVLSLSSSETSPQLWAHYGDNYRGVCLAFATTGVFSAAKKVTYYRSKQTEDLSELPDQRSAIEEAVYKNLFLKERGWSYEKEWRIVYNSWTPHFYFSEDDLACIILGENMDDVIKGIIKQIAGDIPVLRLRSGMQSGKNFMLPYDFEDILNGVPLPKIFSVEKWLAKR